MNNIEQKIERYIAIIKKETQRNEGLETINEDLRQKQEHLLNVLKSRLKRQKNKKLLIN